jgi:superfamily II DNA or RNA helicase
MPVEFRSGQRVRIPGEPSFATVDDARETPGGWRLYVEDDAGRIRKVELTAAEASTVEVLVEDGAADPGLLVAAFWTEWMAAATVDAKATALASSVLRAYAHQDNAVYGAMLPQPSLRFLLADEPGTGKTVMAGMYVREMQRLGFVRRALVVAPAHLVSKWQADFERFFGGGLRRITADTAREGLLRPDHDLWIVSLDLASVNPAVQEILRPDLAGWDLVVFDEGHRLTPTAQSYYRVGELLCRSPRVLVMTATPHRGKEWLFRALMHLVDPEVFPPVDPGEEDSRRVKPGPVHFLRRMKEDLVDYDGVTPLFRGRTAHNVPVALNAVEAGFYKRALDMVDQFFPSTAAPLARMVYGKRAASSLHALAETLKRRREGMGSAVPSAAAMDGDPDLDDPAARDEARVVVEQSRAAKAEREELDRVLAELEPLVASPQLQVSKWPRMLVECLEANHVRPGVREQAVVFTEYADTANWLVRRFRSAGYSAERYSGRDTHLDRDTVRARFALRDFQVLVSTDAGNEGIDLQTAHVLVNWDIPWSLVRLEQRMGRIHRVGQDRDVELYNVIATDTREGEVLRVLLENFVTAANQLDGKLFDSLSLVAEMVDLDTEQLLTQTYSGGPGADAAALATAQAVTATRLEAAARKVADEENALKSAVDVAAAVAALQRQTLERINPRVVEAFLARLARSGHWILAPHAGGEGLWVLSSRTGSPLPKELGGNPQAVIASSGSAIAKAAAAGAQEAATAALSLGPSEPSFRALVAAAAHLLRPSLFRGGSLLDRTSVTDYYLFCYQADVAEAGGRRRTTWPFLIRVDDTGARRVRWEVLANYEAAGQPAGPPHPARASEADRRAELTVADERVRRHQALQDWLAKAERELERLPSSLTAGIGEPERRRAERARLQQSVANRLDALRIAAEVEVTTVRRIGWARIQAGGTPSDPTRANSEEVAMRLVTAVLREDGWAVADVHLEGRGYDLHATRGRAQRCVEVKGVWDQASAQGITLTGNELLIARQLAGDYWLYVADGCSDGRGRLFGTYQNPVETFQGLMQDVALVRVPGSALKAARGEAVSR